MKRVISILLVVMFLLTVTTGCTSNKPKDSKSDVNSSANVNEKIKEAEEVLFSQLEPMPKTNNNEKIGVVIISLTNPYWVTMKECYEKAAKELGIEIEVLAASAEGDKQGQLEVLDAMIVKNYDAIVLSPIEATNLNPGIVRANQSKIPVINLGPGVNLDALKEINGKVNAKITVDFELQGKMAAEDMVRQMPDGGKVAIIQGILGAGQSEGRTKGAKEYFESAKGIDLVSVQPGDWDRNTAYNITTDLIQANPDLKGIFACNDVMALAAVEALEAAGKKDVLVYGIDGIEEAKASIKEGKLSGTITYSSEVYSKAGLLLALKVAQGQEINDTIYSPLSIINKDNVNDFDGFK